MGYGVIQTPAYVAGTTAWQQVGIAVPAGKVGGYSLRGLNIGSALGYANWRLNNGSVQLPGGQNFPIPYQDTGSAPDLEKNHLIPAGFWVEVLASANSVIGYRLDMVFDDA